MHSCVRAGAFFLRRLLQKVDCESLNFGGPVRGQTQLLWGWLQLRENFASGRESARRPVLENELGQNLLVLFFVSVFDSLWFLFVFFCAYVWQFVLCFCVFCGAIFRDCVS